MTPLPTLFALVVTQAVRARRARQVVQFAAGHPRALSTPAMGAVAALALSIAPVFAPAVSAAGTLDPAGQSMGNVVDSAPVSTSLTLAQTFTPSLTGELDSVGVSLGAHPGGPPSEPVSVEIQSTVASEPSGSVLSSAVIQPTDVTASVPDFPLVFVTFTDPPQIAAGTLYAIVLTSREQAHPLQAAATDGTYSGGQLLLNEGGGWTAGNADGLAGLELRFQTRVTRARGQDPWPVGYTDFGAYALCDFDDGTRDLCPDPQHPYVPCFLPDGRTVLCPDRDFSAVRAGSQ